MWYMGSKRRLAKHILPIILADRKPEQWYVEPFCGGCNSLEHVENPRIANDIHPYLISMWRAIQAGWVPPEHITENEYNHIRLHRDEYMPALVGYAGFCSFGAKWFGGFPRASNKDKTNDVYRNIMKQAPKLQGVQFYNVEYYEIPIPPDSIVYCDPPYAGTTKYRTSEFDHEFFWEWCRQLEQTGRQVFVSEYAAPDDFECVFEREQKTTINTNNQPAIERLWRKKNDIN